MRLIQPLSLAMMHRCFTHAGSHHFVAVAMGFFKLGAPNPRFLAVHQSWPEALKALPPKQPLDTLDPKRYGEVLLASIAYPPGGKAVTAMGVSVQVGPISKRLKIIGDRTWRATATGGQKICAPTPFTAMPLTAARAFGGPDHFGNPDGVGYTGKRLGGAGEGAMPNIENPDDPIRHRTQKSEAAGFVAVPITHPARQALLGSFDAAWLAVDAPNMPRNRDTAAFNAAPIDQQMEGFFAGGEPYRLEGLHPTQAVIEGMLPSMRPRIFVQRVGQSPEEAQALDAVFDTVWLIPHLELGVCLYRAQTDCLDPDGEDIAALLGGYESLHDAPRDLAHYHRTLAARTDPKTAHLHAFDDAPLTPVVAAAEQALRQAIQAQAEAEDLAKRQARLDEMEADFWAQSPLEKPVDYQPPKAQPNPLGVIPAGALERGEVDLGAMLTKARALLDEADQTGQQKLAELKEQQQNGPLAEVQAAAPPPPADPAKALAEADERAEPDRPSPLAGVAELEGLDPERQAQLDAAQEKIKGLEDRARRQAVQATRPHPGPEVAAHLRRKVERWIGLDQPLAGRDLLGVDLSGMDLRGCDLSRCNLELANLKTADLRGARLVEAALTGADLRGARLDGADLTKANLSNLKGAGAVLAGAVLDGAMLVDTDLSGADLSAASLNRAVGLRLNLTAAVLDGVVMTKGALLELKASGSRWRGATLDTVILNGADLSGADLSQAHMNRVILVEVQGQGSRWDGAKLTKTLLNKGALSASSWIATHGLNSSWRESDLTGAELGLVRLLRCDLGSADLSGARLVEGALPHCILINAKFIGADLRQANLFQALARKTDFTQADLRGANLVLLERGHALFDDADLRGAVETAFGAVA